MIYHSGIKFYTKDISLFFCVVSSDKKQEKHEIQ